MKDRKIKIKGDDLKSHHIIGYGIGHFFNDFTASLWFYYMSYYLTEILSLSRTSAGSILLAGQITDGIGTLLVGFLSDKTNSPCGKRIPYYIAGFILKFICFAFLFQPCYFCPEDHLHWSWSLYYATLASIFNLAWAAVNVSHFSLAPTLSFNKKNTQKMVRVRTIFIFVAQLLALCLTLFFTWQFTDKIDQYRYLDFTMLIVGSCFSIAFLCIINEKKLTENIDNYLKQAKSLLASLKDQESNDENVLGLNEEENESEVKFTYWLGKSNYWFYLFVYVFVKLSINLTMVLIPYFMEATIGINKPQGGGTPIETTLSLISLNIGSILNNAFLQSWLEKKFNKNTVKRKMFGISTVFSFVGGFPLLFLCFDTRFYVYPLMAITGIGFSMGLNISSYLINDVVASKAKYGAFVFGSYSFSEKFLNGLFFFFFIPFTEVYPESLRYIVSCFPSVTLFCGFLSIFIYSLVIQNSNSDGNMSLLEHSNITFVSSIHDGKL